MITSIEIKNINSIKECKLNFEKAKYKYKEDMIFNSNYVNPIGIYGANGSGKSSLLKAFFYLLNLLNGDKDEFNTFKPNKLILRDIIKSYKNPKALNIVKKCKSSLSITFKINNIEYKYFIETNQISISSEKLTRNKRIIFTRDNYEYYYNRYNYIIKEDNIPLLKKLYEERINDEDIRNAYNYLSNIVYYSPSIYINNDEINKNDLLVYFSENNKNKNDITFIKNDDNDYIYKFKVNEEYIELPLETLSYGTRKMYIILSIISRLDKYSTMIIDDLDIHMHYDSIMTIINYAKEKNVQLIFSSHNTYILQKLRPDQIIITNYNNGFSTYNKLSDIYPNIREINNVEKMYLSGLFNNSEEY